MSEERLLPGPTTLVSGGVVSKTLSLTSLRRGYRGLAQARTDKLVFSPPPRSRKPTVLELWYTAAQGPTAGPRTRRTAGPSCCALLNCRAGSKPAGDEPAETTWVKRRGSVSSR
ncbi:predicted protein [Chaetomium globosum CBS 148.51]|uniref:Uncharacterized protein n=1 Tax=Chaetomium globosum (strain ATCC 6205 / CBS 148.51 / DSM 1962 / NBRC 6347 / NRRL 1970) TaxID=306901 RepID=Q2HGS7_CHAGB|nr:uncharacterized protein CHGG_00577 [Chaetomium globosum CBS 148.51]EAQ92342.1 predicted protein [Chaetomium globosum CBS 148.51]